MPEKTSLRNVFIYDHEGNIISGFWQYGLIDWEEFHSIFSHIISTAEEWAILTLTEGAIGDKTSRNGTETVPEGKYVILTPDGKPMKVQLQGAKARPRNLSVPTTDSEISFYRDRARERDPYCLITKTRHVGEFDRFQVTHIFPRAHYTEWVNRHIPSQITDPAPANQVGGPPKIDSIQNVILLRRDLQAAWDNYAFGVNPDKNYIVIPFIRGYDDIAGKTLNLEHIQDPNLRPLDDLFRDHFLQCVFKRMKGADEPSWDHENTFGPGAFDLSQTDIWGTSEGRDQLELTLTNRLYSTMIQQQQSQSEH